MTRKIRDGNWLYKNLTRLVSNFKDKAEDYFDEGIDNIKEPKLNFQKTRPVETIMVEFSVRNVIKITIAILLILLFLYLAYHLRWVITILLVSILVAVALFPAVNFLERRMIPRVLSVLIVYLFIIFVFSFVLYNIIPTLSSQLFSLAQSVKNIVENLLEDPNFTVPVIGESLNDFIHETRKALTNDVFVSQIQKLLTSLGVSLSYWAGNSVMVLGEIFNGVYNLVLVLVLAFFFMIDAEYVVAFFTKIIPGNYSKYVMAKASLIRTKVNYWVRGQLTLSLIIGVLTYIGLWVIHLFVSPVPYKETIAIVAAFLELIPYVGPIITALFALMVVAGEGTWVFLSVLILSVLIQSFENNLIVPIVMKRAVGVPSLVILIFILIGARFYGFLGILLAVPIVAIISSFFEDFFEHSDDKKMTKA